MSIKGKDGESPVTTQLYRLKIQMVLLFVRSKDEQKINLTISGRKKWKISLKN
jgi:hypothetical protein